jgi:transcriptional regulator with XRE-family HTH domain
MTRLKLLRYERGLTRAEVVAATGVPLGTLQKLEDGHSSEPTAPVAKKLADFYELTVAQLLGLEPNGDDTPATEVAA